MNPSRLYPNQEQIMPMSFEKTYDRNSSFSHTFADEAGNTMTTTVEVDQLDLTAPSFKYLFNGSALTGNTTKEPVTAIITPNEDCTLTIGRKGDRIKSSYSFTTGAPSTPVEYVVSANGVFEIIAIDTVGNKSTGQFNITFIDTEAPRITLPTGSVFNLVQNENALDADLASVLAKLKDGVTANDAIDGVREVTLAGLTVNDLKK